MASVRSLLVLSGLVAGLLASPAAPAPLQGAQAAPAPVQSGSVVRGSVRQGGAPVASARVTLFDPALVLFRETRTDANGAFALAGCPAGAFRLGVAARGLEYEERPVVLPGAGSSEDFALLPESHPGQWQVIGNTLPEFFDATDIAALRPDGSVLFCHDTLDPILFHPVSGQKILGPSSGSSQGCMNTTLLEDGSVLFAGGQNGSFTNAIPWVKTFGFPGGWTQLASMLLPVGRWYPGLARLADGRILVMGGGTAPSAARTDTCEIFDPATGSWSWTGAMGSAVEFPPAVLLYTGKVLRTWGTVPQLFDPQAGTWSDTGALVHPSRGYPGHSDHRLIVLEDGRALVVGLTLQAPAGAAMTEVYEPSSGTWSAGTSPSLRRMQCEVVPLPDGRVLVQGGEKAAAAGPEPHILGIVRRCDLLDPASGGWRRVADTLQFREYHAVTLLLPDARVLTTGGTQIKFQYGPVSADIDAFSPPYLFRGVRPVISALSDSTPHRGQSLSFRVFPRTRLTHAVLLGAQTTTHWVDGGVPRRLVLSVDQQAGLARVTLPTDPNVLPLGWYLLFGMVDDIPSKALFLRVDP